MQILHIVVLSGVVSLVVGFTPPVGRKTRQVTSLQQNMSSNECIVLLDPVTEWKKVVEAATKQCNLVCIAVYLSPIPSRLENFCPSTSMLRESGVEHVLDLQDRDVFRCAKSIQLVAARNGLHVKGVIPLGETAVDFSDILASLLGLHHFNTLSLALARRDKGDMKEAVRAAGLLTAKFSRILSKTALASEMTRLELEYPVVIKTPQGFSTRDVYVCHSASQADQALDSIISSKKKGPDERQVDHALLEEYIGGTEFAVNIMCTATTTEKILVTDIWQYEKDAATARYHAARNCDPNDPKLQAIADYAVQICKAVGIHYGAGHVELKAHCSDEGYYENPTLIEVGARLSGGQKATMSQIASKGRWDPFVSLIQSHCGNSLLVPPTTTPQQHVQHLFLPLLGGPGKIKNISLEDTLPTLKSLHSHAMLVKVGDEVRDTHSSEITACAGFVWLVGDRDAVEMDASTIWSSFQITWQES